MALDLTLGTMLLVRDLQMVPEHARLAQDAGNVCVQLHFDNPEATLDEVREVGRILAGHGLATAAVCCHLARNRAEDFTFTSLDGVHWLIDAAGILESPRLVMWSGSYSNELRGEDPRNFTAEAMDLLETEYRKFVPATASAGLTVCVEPFYPHVTGTPERMAEFCGRFEPGQVACCLDTPNFISHGIYDQTNALIPSIIGTVAPYVELLHFKDIRRDDRGNLGLPGPGDGILDYPVVMAELAKLDRPLVGITEHITPEQYARAHDFIAGLV